ncbi:DUF1615 domain-containing protein [Thermomonas sp. HDW16]|uniref:DUF1615 domain-containing protein n=1 Tax=Thermomonas sp. HDW16 TaxID=2714945 RepID=UPI00140E40FB|nr:DUF1615 domain-containing protein [Thermomonas sp. HDW16]QIL21186.1 DUF1615 domain-containing protein [Thermomonas sp. HDW16]
MTPVPRRHRVPLLLALCLGIACLPACEPQRTPEQVRAELLRKLPATLHDRDGWARDIQAAFAAQRLDASTSNLCAVLAVIEQESTYRADPPVPGLAKIARAEIDRRAEKLHVPHFMVEAALRFHSPDGRTYAQRIDALRTEQELSELFEEMTHRVPMGQRLFARYNPVRTGGPMQVRIDFAQRHLRGYPYPVEGSVRSEVFSRRGGLYFGIKHLLGYPVDYDRSLYRFADFNAGWYASRNAAFQQAAAIASGTQLVRDGDLLAPGATMDKPGATETALRRIAPRLGLDAAGIRAALAQGRNASFANTDLYQRVYAIADGMGTGKPVVRARVPDIALDSPKITRKLTTAWFAERVNARWNACMVR